VRELREIGRAIVAAIIAATFVVDVGLAVGLAVGLMLYVGSFVAPATYRRTLSRRRRLSPPRPIRDRRLRAANLKLADELDAMADKLAAGNRDDEKLRSEALAVFERAHVLAKRPRADGAVIQDPRRFPLLPEMFRSMAAEIRESAPLGRRRN
jgi:hypothetical protein